MQSETQTLRNRFEAFLSEAPSGGGSLCDHLVLFGAGETCAHYEKTFLHEQIEFTCFLDNNPMKQGQIINGKPVLSVRQYLDGDLYSENNLILIVSGDLTMMAEIREQLEGLGLRYQFIDAFIFRKHKKELLDVFDSLEDDFSRKTYFELLLAKCGVYRRFPFEICRENQYYDIPEFRRIHSQNVFVDLGAYVGDSLETFLWKMSGVFRKAYAFEPEKLKIEAMKARVERLKREWALGDDQIELVQAGIGETNAVAYATASPDEKLSPGTILNANAEGGEAVPIYSLDQFFADREETVSFIKADIESYEYEMLLGAKQIIRTQKPKLAICIYHGASDFYRIPLLVREFCPEYRLSIRHHHMDLSETVLYAY